MVEGPEVTPTLVCLERNAQCFKGSIQLAGRKKPLRHLIGLSEVFAAANVSSCSAKTALLLRIAMHQKLKKGVNPSYSATDWTAEISDSAPHGRDRP